jgi:hypothetical protein
MVVPGGDAVTHATARELRGFRMKKYRVEVEFQEFGWSALHEAAESQGVTIEELIQHAAMYYLASADQGRISHKVPAASAAESPAQVGL